MCSMLVLADGLKNEGYSFVALLFPGGDTPIYGLYRYVPRDRVWFLRFSVLK